MPENQPQILFLPRWYPHRYDPMPGLFVKRQADAISRFCDVAVLYVHEDVHCPNKFEIDVTDEERVKVVRVYYRVPIKHFPVLGSFLKVLRFLKAYWLGFRVLTSCVPDLLHVHVMTRTGLIAMIYGLFRNTPYIISEHWSRYFPENGTYKGAFRKLLTKLIVRRAAALIPVSGKLKDAMQQNGLKNREIFIVPNVVDMDSFVLAKEKSSQQKIRMIHVSCFEDKSKNISGFLRAVKKISLARTDFEVLLVGEGPDLEKCRMTATDLGLDESIVKFTGLKEQEELVKLLSGADFMVLSSLYETFGTVVIESLSCGTPVVATNVGVVPEVINGKNGIVVPPGDDEALERGVLRMMDQFAAYDKKEIRDSVPPSFSMESIGKQLFSIYCRILNS
jgi:glycosyltransferase involved in cell wall biosynthesis